MTPFGVRIRALRGEHGITMAAMAAELKVSPAYLSQLERGLRGAPAPAMLDQICALFGLIWQDAEDLKHLGRLSQPRVVLDARGLGVEAVLAANLFAQLLPKVSADEARAMAAWLEQRLDDT